MSRRFGRATKCTSKRQKPVDDKTNRCVETFHGLLFVAFVGCEKPRELPLAEARKMRSVRESTRFLVNERLQALERVTGYPFEHMTRI